MNRHVAELKRCLRQEVEVFLDNMASCELETLDSETLERIELVRLYGRMVDAALDLEQLLRVGDKLIGLLGDSPQKQKTVH
ncbi:hypothetical protein [Azotobacter salinestris]|uniref:hypothetical protein n=1 Tax=Azotobacter salinestris TaxID=69964 RepID=UPI001266B0D7|nr:hypothetical protein [Azotobacter salinestris]